MKPTRKLSDHDNGWLLAWLAFGVLAAYEFGALAMRLDGDWGALLSLVFLVGSAGSLSVVALRAIRHAHPGKFLAPLILMLLAPPGCLWLLYGGGVPAECVTAVMFFAAYSTACGLVSGAAMAGAWRRRRAHQARMAQLRVQRSRQQSLEGMRVEGAAPLAAAASSADDSEPSGADGNCLGRL